MTYDEVRKDWEYLWNINPADDMTGGYVDQDDLDKLLKKPTKITARECMQKQIGYWFQVGPDPFGIDSGDPDWYINNDPIVYEIAERYGEI